MCFLVKTQMGERMFWGVMGWGGIRRNGDGWDGWDGWGGWGGMGYNGVGEGSGGFLVGERFGIYFLLAEAPDG